MNERRIFTTSWVCEICGGEKVHDKVNTKGGSADWDCGGGIYYVARWRLFKLTCVDCGRNTEITEAW